MKINEREDSKRVAKNTLILYSRMIVMSLIGLYTSRVMLHALGIENYGINNVVGGFLTIFTIIATSMNSAVSRFLTVELGKKDVVRIQKVFTTTVNVMILTGLLVVLLIETVGLWFLNNELNIPENRLWAANWVLHFAAIGTVTTLFLVPYNASLIAHEEMSMFAYLSILDAILKLTNCYLIYISPLDKLVTFAALGFLTSVLMNFIYLYYCKKKFTECRYSFSLDKKIFTEVWTFATWHFLGQTSWVLNTQGTNLLVNIFFGVNYNAARGIAEQVNQKINQFVSGFMISLTPQITKAYASGNKEYAYKLACRGARFSFYIMFIIALPIMLESKQLLQIWLVTPPKYADIFVVWTILSTLIITLGSTLVTLQLANGNIKKYEIIMALLSNLTFPTIWLLFKLGATVFVAYWVFALSYWILIFVRFWLVHNSTGIYSRMYLIGVILRCHIIGVISTVIPITILYIMNPSFLRLAVIFFTSIASSCTCIYFLGVDKQEQVLIRDQIKKRICVNINV